MVAHGHSSFTWHFVLELAARLASAEDRVSRHPQRVRLTRLHVFSCNSGQQCAIVVSRGTCETEWIKYTDSKGGRRRGQRRCVLAFRRQTRECIVSVMYNAVESFMYMSAYLEMRSLC